MDTFSNRLKMLRESKSLTLQELADDINKKYNLSFTKGMMSKWENGKGSPSITSATFISEYFHVSLDYLLGIDKNSTIYALRNIPKSEQTLLHKYRSIDSKGKHTVDTVLEMEYNRCNKPHLVVNAAHAIEDSSEEDQQWDDDIMDNF